MISKKQLLKSWKIYAILDDSLFQDRQELLRKFYELLESPVDVVQLRFKNLTSSLCRAAKEMSEAAKRRNVPLIINDRPDLALWLGASGVHLGKGDIPAGIARKILGPKAIIGRTIRNTDDLRQLDRRAVDYAAIGPVFRTPLKPELKPVPRSIFRKVLKTSRVPVVAIGSIKKENVGEVIKEGIKTVAFVRYGITEKDTRRKIKELRKML